jgi:hypothetical protein
MFPSDGCRPVSAICPAQAVDVGQLANPGREPAREEPLRNGFLAGASRRFAGL